MVVIGSILGIENSQALGCMIGLQMLSIGNLIFLTTSVALLTIAMKSNNSNVALKLLLIETVIWVTKYLFYKGGYITGFGGTANPINVVYDFVAIAFRIWFVLSLSKYAKCKISGGVILALLLVIIKIHFFALPWFTKII